jgi:magnesium-transporting ATPase (P-type)
MAIAFYLALTSDHSFTDAIVILAIVVLNISLAVRQEMGAEKALEALRRMNAQITVVIRNSQPQPIDAIMLVPGDIVSLQAGDLIPADARIIESIDLKVEESALTGESVAVEKDANAIIDSQASIGDRLNMLFSGCLVTNGRARAIVVATGMQTEMGKIALLLNTTKRSKTPLQKKMDVFGRIICFVGLGAGALLFLLQVFSEPLPVVLLNAVSLAVAVIPECLPIIVTITLAYGVSNMAKKQAIIRRIPAVETLGSASVICTDKTGTLTQNRMTVQQVWSVNHQPKATDVELNHDERILVEMMGLASNASLGSRTSETLDTGDRDLNKNSNSEYVDKTVGDPTETAILLLLRDIGIEKPSLDAIYPRVFEIPFDSERKLMTTVHELDDHRYISITKGAFDRIPVEASAKSAQAAQVVHDQFAEGALRVLAVAYKYYEDLPVNLGPDELEAGLTFAGLVGMIDPPRPETLDAVETARQAGIKTVMITGDHALTASAIASQTGILATGGRVVTGAEMAKMSDDDLALHVLDYSVYARVSPEDKIRIVKAWQSKGEVVAMTGDGVNDAPALKAADVGVAMGSGTDVSKNASDVVLTDDNYASIVNAVAEGRRVYDNIRKVISSLVACNMSEILIILFAVILGWGTPLVAIQLLFINVVADGIPDLCMCREPMEADVMRRRPISQSASIFTGGLGIRISIVAVVFTIISLAGFYLGSFVQISDSVAPSHAIGQTMAYVVIGWSSVVNIINVRSYDKSILTIGLLSNRLLFYGICLSLVLVAVTAGVPVVRDVFYCVPLSLTHWLVITGLSITPLFVVELIKLMQRGKKSISY